MSANDTHLPSNFAPMAYAFVGGFDNAPEPGSFIGSGGDWFTEWGQLPGTNPLNAEYSYLRGLLAASPTSAYGDRGLQCDHCGAHIRYVVVVQHTPTGDHIALGERCVDRIGSMDRATWKVGELRKAAQAARKAAATRAARAANAERYPELVAWIIAHEGRWIPQPVFWCAQIAAEGAVWDDTNTAAALAATVEYDAEDARRAIVRAQREATKQPAPAGRVQVVGEVVKVGYKENDFGGAWKMTVAADGGFMCWGSVPSAIVDAHRLERFLGAVGAVQATSLDVWLKGKRVQFTATLEPKDDDPCFAFFKRPAKAELVVAA